MSVKHTDVAAYSLGLLEPTDKLDFEAHLAQCDSCAAELAEFSAMAELFAGIGEPELADDEPDDATIADLVSRRALAQRRRTRQRAVLAIAACLVLIATGIATGAFALPRPSSSAGSGLVLTGVQHKATNPATGITGTVGLASKPWGTQVTLELGRVKGPLDCELIAVSKTGEQRVMVGWLVPASGYGVPGHPADLLIEGGTSINVSDLAAIKIDVVRGRTLLTIPI